MLYILLLKCHSATLHHIGLSKHFCCNGSVQGWRRLKAATHRCIVSLWFLLGYVIPTVHYWILKHYRNARQKCLPFFFPTQKVPTFWRIIQNVWLMKLMGQEAGLSLLATQFLANWSSLLFITQTAETCIFSDPHCTTYPTINGKTLTLSWENTRKATEKSKVIISTQIADAKGQIAEGKKIKEKINIKKCPGAYSQRISISDQVFTGMNVIWGTRYQPPVTSPADRDIWNRVHCINFQPHVQPQCSETQFYVILASFWVEFSVGVCRKKLLMTGAWLGHLALHPDIPSSS